MSEFFFIVDRTVPGAESAAIKIAKEAKPGSLIMLSHEEFEAWKKGAIKINLPSSIGDEKVARTTHNP